MIHALFALIAIAGLETPTTQQVAAPATSPVSQSTNSAERFADRPQARIAFSQQVRNFQIKRDGNDDVLYLETNRDRWFRSEISCFGINDPRDAYGLVSLDHTSGFDRFSRIGLVDFGRRTTECRLNGLVQLTPEEAVQLELVKPRRTATTKTSPAS